MLTICTKNTEISKFHTYLLAAVAPRPIALTSTMDKFGKPNLSPFSFFNVFSANPPILIFSPARRVRNNTTKHSLENAKDTMEVVINVVILFPESIKNSRILTGNNLGMLGNIASLPSDQDVDKFLADNPEYLGLELNEKHRFAQEFLKKNDVSSAWKVLLS